MMKTFSTFFPLFLLLSTLDNLLWTMNAVSNKEIEDLRSACLQLDEKKIGNILSSSACSSTLVNSKWNNVPEQGCTPLIFLAFKGSAQLIHTLIEYGAHVEYKDSLEYTALDYAILGGNIDAIRALCDSGAPICMNNKICLTKLSPAVAKLLYSYGAANIDCDSLLH